MGTNYNFFWLETLLGITTGPSVEFSSANLDPFLLDWSLLMPRQHLHLTTAHQIAFFGRKHLDSYWRVLDFLSHGGTLMISLAEAGLLSTPTAKA